MVIWQKVGSVPAKPEDPSDVEMEQNEFIQTQDVYVEICGPGFLINAP